MKRIEIYFHVQHLYHLPQFLPVYEIMRKHGVNCLFVFILQNSDKSLIEKISKIENIEYIFSENDKSAFDVYIQAEPEWIIFGNDFDCIKELPPKIKTALLYHGVGIKDCYYDKALSYVDVRFVEGEYRYEQIKKRFPDADLLNTGFAKLDPIINQAIDIKSVQKLCGIDENKKTLLYAPTFYPSSIEKMNKNWPEEFSEFNIIIKAHQFTFTKSAYKAQADLMEYWSNFNNVYVAGQQDYSLVPFMAVADILISDASSAIFEFAALNKPVIWCDFIKLRWNYRGIFKYRYSKRMDSDILRYADIAYHVSKYKHLKRSIIDELNEPNRLQLIRRMYTDELLGSIDGHASDKICTHLKSSK